MGEPLTKSMLQIVTELDEGNADDEDITPARSALGMIDVMAQQLPANNGLKQLTSTCSAAFFILMSKRSVLLAPFRRMLV